jgi:stage V sporulation protein SpoVS
MKVNKYVKKVVTGTVSASILASSCVPHPDITDDDSIYGVNGFDENLGKIAVPISINLTPKGAKYIAFLQKLSEDIIRDTAIAREFSKNPESFLQKYGYNESISLEEGMLKLILALGDEDINNAIKNNDIKQFYNLCKGKDLLNASTFTSLVNNDEIRDKINELGLDNSAIPELQALFLAVPVLIFIAVAVFVAVAAEVLVYVHSEASTIGQAQFLMEAVTDNNPILKIWALRDKKDKTYLVVDEFVENQINETIETIKQQIPSYFEKNSEEDLRNLLKLNILNQ